jgi:hypothetical protein
MSYIISQMSEVHFWLFREWSAADFPKPYNGEILW